MATAITRPGPAHPTFVPRRTLLTAIAWLVLLAPAYARAQEAGGIEDMAYAIEIVVFAHRAGAPADLPATSPDEPGIYPAPPAWPPLTAADMQLDGIAARLRQVSGSYQLLYHGGWTQSVTGQARSAATPLPAAAVASGLTGTITVYRERYLHALVDVGLAQSTVRLRQGRRLRGQGLQYFDHPALGVILSVREAKAGDPDPAPGESIPGAAEPDPQARSD
ncbi:MAG: peptidoglycan binding protein CsiV [Gammaproteobacteria bacterium]|nr:peptidoglycan binding protein CsiV [Gammaproteobacteria bacterium]